MSATLERLDPEVVWSELENPISDDVADSELLDKSHEMMGYSYQHEENRREDTQKRELAHLLNACDATGCRYPFKKESVEKYKARQKLKANLLACLPMFSFFCIGIACIVLPFALKASVVCFSVSVLVGVCFLVLGGFLSDNTYAYDWDRCAVSAYANKIPEYALQTACDLLAELREKHPDESWHCYVDELAAKQKVYDPFLVISRRPYNGGEYYYLEEWREPKYKQERMS